MTPLIMIIDDSLTMRTIIETCLKREGFEIVSYPDGIQALDALHKRRHRIPDLVILDIGLPRLDGYEIARLLRRTPVCSEMVIIMLSGRDSVLDRLKGRLAGANDYLTKPFRTHEVLTVIFSYLDAPLVAQEQLHSASDRMRGSPSTDGAPHAGTLRRVRFYRPDPQ